MTRTAPAQSRTWLCCCLLGISTADWKLGRSPSRFSLLSTTITHFRSLYIPVISSLSLCLFTLNRTLLCPIVASHGKPNVWLLVRDPRPSCLNPELS